MIEGHIRVPLEWTHTMPFTNARHQFTGHIADSIKRWVEWREHKGWKLNSQPKVRGPFEAPTANALAEKPDFAIYTVTAWFQPTEPLSIGFDDAHELQLRAKRYGVDIHKPKPVSTPIEAGKAVIVDSGPFGDPMRMAAERRKQYGLKREDLLIGNLSDPWPERT